MRWGQQEIVGDESSYLGCKEDQPRLQVGGLENRLVGTISWVITAPKINEFHKPDLQLDLHRTSNS